MKIFDLLVGKKMIVETDMGVMAELEIESVQEQKHSEDLGPATPANDWWPPTREWTTYVVKFTTGKTKTYSSLNEINFF